MLNYGRYDHKHTQSSASLVDAPTGMAPAARAATSDDGSISLKLRSDGDCKPSDPTTERTTLPSAGRSAAALSVREGLALGPPRRSRFELRCAAERVGLLARPWSPQQEGAAWPCQWRAAI